MNNITFDPTKLEEYERITPAAEKVMELLGQQIFIIEKYNTKERYDKMIWMLMRNMCQGFEHREFRDFPVNYKFRDDENEDVKWLPFRHFIINVMMWRPMICIDPENLDESFIIPSSSMGKLSPTFIKNYMDTHYVSNYNRHIPNMPNIKIEEINPELNLIFADTNFFLTRISAYFSKFLGISSNIEIFIDLAKRIPEFNELIHFKLDPSKQPAEIENDMDDLLDRTINCILKDGKWNQLKPLVQKKSGLNLKQLRDLAGNIALKPDNEGKTMPYPINVNYLTGELSKIQDYYRVAISGRKAQIINNEFMGKSGHLLILISIACSNITLSKTTTDCNTVNPIPIKITTKNHLNKLDGRRYRFAGEIGGYKIINSSEDTNLIGETIYVRSPITCSCKDGVCRECYGDLYYTNIDNYRTGIFSATFVMNPVVQGILSAKHHQTTSSEMIEFREEFGKFFTISATDIILSPDDDIDLMDYTLVIRRDFISTSDEEENELDYTKKRRRKKRNNNPDTSPKNNGDGEDFDLGEEDESSLELSMTYYTTKFEIVKNFGKKDMKPEIMLFEDKDSKELYMHTDFVAKMSVDKIGNDDCLYIPMEDINADEFVFLVDVENNELTKPMKKIQKVLNNNAHEGCTTYEDLTNKLLDLMIESKLAAMSVHGEIILRNLVRRSTNVLKRPDFSRVIMQKDYQLLTITSALKKDPAINTSLSTPYLKNQLVDQTETFMKTAESVFDPYFRPTLTEEN